MEFKAVNSEEEIKKIVEDSKPDKGKDTGFWMFDEDFQKDPTAYLSINRKPWYILYDKVIENGEIVGIVAYSLKREKDALFILTFQKDKTKKCDNFVSKIMPHYKELAKKNNKSNIELVAYNSELKQYYINKHGFREILKTLVNETLMTFSQFKDTFRN